MATSVPGITAGVGAASKAEADHEKATANLASEREKMATALRKEREDMESRQRDRTTRDAARESNRAKAEAEKEAADGSKAFAVGLGIAVLSVRQFIQTLQEIKNLQKSGSESTGNLRARMGRAGQDLKMAPSEVERIIKQQESGKPLPGGMTREEDVAFWESAGDTARKAGFVPNLNELAKIRNADYGVKIKMDAAGIPGAPMVAPMMAGAGKAFMAPTATAALNDTAMIAASKERGDAAVYRKGANKRKAAQDYETSLQNEEGLTPIINTVPGGRFVTEAMQEQKYINQAAGGYPTSIPFIRFLSQISEYTRESAKNTTPPPPSTNPTR